jgi:hypothetical protein
MGQKNESSSNLVENTSSVQQGLTAENKMEDMIFTYSDSGFYWLVCANLF